MTMQLLSRKVEGGNATIIDQTDPSLKLNAEAAMDQTHRIPLKSDEENSSIKRINLVRNALSIGTNQTQSSNSSVVREKCLKKYGKRYFFQESQKRTPPMLYTFPGSGNTWCRLLVEYSIGIFSGKKHSDMLFNRFSSLSIFLLHWLIEPLIS